MAAPAARPDDGPEPTTAGTGGPGGFAFSNLSSRSPSRFLRVVSGLLTGVGKVEHAPEGSLASPAAAAARRADPLRPPDIPPWLAGYGQDPGDQGRLADSRLAFDQYHRDLTAAEGLHGSEENRKLRFAANPLRGARRPHQLGWLWLISRHSVGESP
jgi:hypothetical protein